jgi:hypothetical protein
MSLEEREALLAELATRELAPCLPTLRSQQPLRTSAAAYAQLERSQRGMTRARGNGVFSAPSPSGPGDFASVTTPPER